VTPAAKSAVTPPSEAVTWGASGAATTLVVYDTTNTWGWLGELYAIGAGNLATHFGKVTAEPVVDYVSGQVNNYTTTIYIGSTYNEPIPQTFLNDVLGTTKPVIWIGDNIWQLTGSSGSAADTAFETAYGWDPATSYFDTADTIPSVSYKSQTFTRSTLNTGGILAPHITTASQVSVLASANCTTTAGAAVNCNEIAQSTGTSFPWAIRSSNLMYIGEVPLSYMSLTDRYVAFADLLFDDLAPTATPSHEALVRIEDVSRVGIRADGVRRLPEEPGGTVQHRAHPRLSGPDRLLQQRRARIGDARPGARDGDGAEDLGHGRRHHRPARLHAPVLGYPQPVHRGQRG
jgi:uncharacterized protein YdaL